MDDLLREFLTETSESLDTVDNQLVRFEQDPSDAKILDNIFRLVHTIKGTCGFLGLAAAGSAGPCRRDPDGQIPRRHAGQGRGRDADPVLDRPHQRDSGRPRGHRDRARGHRRRPDREAACDGRRRQACGGRAGARASPRRCRTARSAGGDIRHADRAGAGTPAASRRSLARRPRARLPRDRDRSRARAQTRAGPRRQAGRTGARAGSRSSSQGSQGKTRQARRGRRIRRPGSRQDRQPVDPRQRRHARTSDDHGLRAGVDPQPASGNLPPQRGHRVQGAAAAAVQRHRRAAGRRHEDADAADRQCLAEAAAHRPRPKRRTRQADRARDARRRHRARPPGARPDQGSVDAHGAQLRRPRPGDAGRAAGLRQGRAGHHHGFPPITRAATSSSASPTMAAGSTPSGSRPRRSRTVSSPRPSWRR